MFKKDSEWVEVKKISVARWYEPLVACLVVAASYLLFYKSNLSDVDLSLLIIAISTFVYFLLEIFKQNLKELFSVKQEFISSIKNTSIKFLGVLFGVALTLFCYWLFPDYHQAKIFIHISEAIPTFLYFFLPISFLYIFITEVFKGAKKDQLYMLGMFVVDVNLVNWKLFLNGIFEWAIRLFFLSLNFVVGVEAMKVFRAGNPFVFGSDFLTTILSVLGIIFLLIIFTILPGYVFSSRLIGTEVRSVDKSLLAWVFTLVCYPPFWATIFTAYLAYEGNTTQFGTDPAWFFFTKNILIGGQAYVLFVVAGLIIFLELVHLWGEATLGIRSSNLTNRGIITTGPFRYTKHPVYLSKCLGWLIIFLPIFSGYDILDSVRISILFGLVCSIYLIRSYVEEKLLATDEDYVKYAIWMDKNATFSFINKFFPFMSFEWRYNYWKKNNLLNYE